jgi:hypothetical protein
MDARKYPRTAHLPYSPGATSDDRIARDWQHLLAHELVVTEKLDGENTCLRGNGVYARSHAAPTRNPWANNAWEIWRRVQTALGELEVFGENLYAVHSIEYRELPAHFFVFAIRLAEEWLAWDDVCFYAAALELPVVPVRARGRFTELQLKQLIHDGLAAGSLLGGPCEGFVVRNAAAFAVDEFGENVLKYVRAQHVQTDAHWTRNWKRAELKIQP